MSHRISADDAIAGVPDVEWVRHASQRLKQGQTAELVAEATTDRMRAAGNVGGELLNWIALLGAAGARPVEVPRGPGADDGRLRDFLLHNLFRFGVGGVTIEHYVRGIKAHLTSPEAG